MTHIARIRTATILAILVAQLAIPTHLLADSVTHRPDDQNSNGSAQLTTDSKIKQQHQRFVTEILPDSTTITYRGGDTVFRTFSGVPITATFSTLPPLAQSSPGTLTETVTSTNTGTATSTPTTTETATATGSGSETATTSSTGTYSQTLVIPTPGGTQTMTYTTTATGTFSTTAFTGANVTETYTYNRTDTSTSVATLTFTNIGSATGTGTGTMTVSGSATATSTKSGTASATYAVISNDHNVTEVKTATGSGTASRTLSWYSTWTELGIATATFTHLSATGTGTASGTLTNTHTATSTSTSTSTATQTTTGRSTNAATGRLADGLTLDIPGLHDNGTTLSAGSGSSPRAFTANGGTSQWTCGQMSDISVQAGCVKGLALNTAQSIVRSNGSSNTWISVPSLSGQIDLSVAGGYTMFSCTRAGGCGSYGNLQAPNLTYDGHALIDLQKPDVPCGAGQALTSTSGTTTTCVDIGGGATLNRPTSVCVAGEVLTSYSPGVSTCVSATGGGTIACAGGSCTTYRLVMFTNSTSVANAPATASGSDLYIDRYIVASNIDASGNTTGHSASDMAAFAGSGWLQQDSGGNRAWTIPTATQVGALPVAKRPYGAMNTGPLMTASLSSTWQTVAYLTPEASYSFMTTGVVVAYCSMASAEPSRVYARILFNGSQLGTAAEQSWKIGDNLLGKTLTVTAASGAAISGSPSVSLQVSASLASGSTCTVADSTATLAATIFPGL